MLQVESVGDNNKLYVHPLFWENWRCASEPEWARETRRVASTCEPRLSLAYLARQHEVIDITVQHDSLPDEVRRGA